MSAQILKMKPQPLRGTAASPRLEPRYYCTHCESERWFITVKLDVACSSCGHIAINLQAVKR